MKIPNLRDRVDFLAEVKVPNAAGGTAGRSWQPVAGLEAVAVELRMLGAADASEGGGRRAIVRYQLTTRWNAELAALSASAMAVRRTGEADVMQLLPLADPDGRRAWLRGIVEHGGAV